MCHARYSQRFLVQMSGLNTMAAVARCETIRICLKQETERLTAVIVLMMVLCDKKLTFTPADHVKN